jgi:hypothetical protein
MVVTTHQFKEVGVIFERFRDLIVKSNDYILISEGNYLQKQEKWLSNSRKSDRNNLIFMAKIRVSFGR